LSGIWILEVLRTSHPQGVLRRVLLDEFAALLVSGRSSRGAKGRLARRLYARLELLQRRGLVVQEEGVVRPLAGARKTPDTMPLLGPVQRKALFLALMVEDRDAAEGNAAALRRARWAFLARAMEGGWTLAQAAGALGISQARAAELIAHPGATA
jgi:hypothetical protein